MGRCGTAALALVAACGTDVVRPELAVDATPSLDAAPPMRVRVLSVGGERPTGAPAVGARVGFLPPTGDAVVITTGDDGLASAAMPSGTTIVVAQSRGFGVDDTTIVLDVGAGAELTLGDRAPTQIVGPNVGVRNATVAPWDGVVELSTSCASGTGGQVGTELSWFQLGCARTADATAVARAFGDDGLEAYAVLRHVDLDDEAALALPVWQPVTRTRLALTNLPIELDAVSVQRTARDDLDDWSVMATGAPVEGASVVVPLRAVPVGDHTTTSVLFLDRGGVAYRAQLQRPLAELTTVVDVGGDAPLRLGPATFDLTERRLAWSYRASGGRRPDVIRALVFSDVDGFGRVHEIIAPGDRTSLVLPPFPPELADVELGPESSASLRGLDAVELPDVAAFADAASHLDLWSQARSELSVGFDRAPFDWWITSD